MFKSNKSLYRFLVSYALLFASLLIITSMSLIFTYYQFRNEIIDKKRSQLSNIESKLSVRFSEIKNMGATLTQQKDVLLRSLSPSIDYSRLDDMNDLQDIIYSYNVVNHLIENTFIYFFETDLIIFPDNISTRFDLSYGGYFSFKGYSGTEWKDFFLESGEVQGFVPTQLIYIDKDSIESPVLVYYQKFPILNIGKGKGVIGIVISVERLKALLIEENVNNPVTIISSQNHIMLQTDLLNDIRNSFMSQNPGEDKGDFIYENSEDWRLKYFLHYNNKDILNELGPVIRIIFLFFLFYFIIGAVITIYLAIKTALPFQNLEDENRSLIEKIKEFQPLLHSFFIHDMIQGNSYSEEDIKEMADELSFPVNRGPYTLLMIEMGRILMNDYSPVILDEMKKQWGTHMLISYESPGRIIFIITNDEGNRESINAFFRSLWVRLDESVLRIVISRSFLSLHHISKVYKETIKFQNYYPSSENIIFTDDISEDPLGYNFPVEYERNLVQFLFQGDMDSARSIWDRVYESTFLKGKLNLSETERIRKEIEGLLMRIQSRLIRDKGLDGESLAGFINKIFFEKRILPRKEIEEALFSWICQGINTQKKSHNDIVRDRIVDFINDNYRKWDLSLDTVAIKVGFSKNYTSNFIKEQLGETFIAYLTRLRIEEAKALLGEGISPQVVAMDVGYNNYNSFFRAFKRETGQNPTGFA